MSSKRRLLATTALAAGLLAGGLVYAQDEPVEWVTSQPTGGPAYGLAVSQYAEDEKIEDEQERYDSLQKVFAAGPDIQSSHRGDEWQHNSGTGPMTSVLAGAEGVVYVASDDGSGYRTTTGGRNWSRVRVRDDDPFRFVAVSPDYNRDRTVFAITSDAWRLYRSGNQGLNWTEITMELGVTEEYGAVAYSPLHYIDEWVFVGSSRGVFKWSVEDQGWKMVSQPDGNVPKFGSEGGSLAGQGLVVPQEYGDDPDRREDPVVQTLFAYNADGLFRSDDDGGTWREITLPAAVERVNGLAVSNGWPTDPVLAVAATGPGIVGAVSNDDGENWTLVQGGDGIQGASVVMSHDFARIPEKDFEIRGTAYLPVVYRGSNDGAEYFVGSREAFIGTDGDGIYRSRDAGQTWEPTSPSYSAVVVTSLASLGGAEDVMLAGSDTAGLYRSEDGGRTWSFADAKLPRGRGEIIHEIRRSPNFASDKTVFLAATSGLWRSRDGGSSWQLTTGPKPVRSLDVSPAFDSDRSLVAGASMSTDGGDTWRPITDTMETYWSALAFSPDYANDHTIWYGTDDVGSHLRYGLYRFNAEDETWVHIAKGPLSNSKIRSLFVLWADPADDLRVFVGGSSGIVASMDNGENWKRPGGAVARSTYSVTGTAIRDPVVRGVTLSASDDVAAWSVNRGVDWTNQPKSPKPNYASAISDDARAIVVGGLMTISRYELDPGE